MAGEHAHDRFTHIQTHKWIAQQDHNFVLSINRKEEKDKNEIHQNVKSDYH